MTLAELKNIYANNSKTASISEAAGNPFSITHLKGLNGSAIAFQANAIFRTSPGIHLFVVPDKEEAAYLLNDLERLCDNADLLFFPSSSRKPYWVEEVANADVLLRAEVLNRVNQFITKGKTDRAMAIVSYPEAISEKVTTRQNLTKNTLILKKGEQTPVPFLVEVFIEYGFERAEYVYEPGQYAVRGGIVDVWSFSSDFPYRIELFGDEVDSIRAFEPVSQISEKNLDFISIIPNVQERIFRESRQAFLEYLPENSYLWLRDSSTITGRINKWFELAEKTFTSEPGLIDQLPPEERYTPENDFLLQAKKFRIIETASGSLFKAGRIFEFSQTPQPVFNKNFDLLFTDLLEKVKQGYKVVILSDTSKQVERLYAIFKDLEAAKGAYGPIENIFTLVLLPIHEGFVDKELKLACYTDHQIFERYHRFQLKSNAYKKNEALTLKEIQGLQPGDFVTHIDHGIGRFGGLEKVVINGKEQETIRIVYKDNDVLNISIHSLHRIAKYAGKDGAPPKIDKLGSNAWSSLKQKTKKKVKEIAYDLIKLYAKRKAEKGFAFSPDNYLQNELEASFIYEDTPDQLKATNDVKRDMESLPPMDRLVCGDVGFGKTEVAIRAAFKAVNDSKQVAVLVPTTILALQHYKTFGERLKGFPVNVDYINRFKSAKQQKETLKKTAEGKIDILIGTHRIVGKDVKFKDLGLLIIDEEQKFGVVVKDKLKTMRAQVDTLTLTATPIPRTLQFSMMGARDLSIINTPPANRYPIQTEIHIFNETVIRDAITYEIERGGQVFFIHNKIGNLADIAGMIQRLCPRARVAIGHGQMDGSKLEAIMLDFVEGQYDVLVSTTIVESGLDIPNANTIIINEAHMFGLSDLHQMRGRVGRTNKKAFCYLLCPPFVTLTDEARKRLKAIEQFSDLGSGFMIAMRDLDIRGAGNLLGAEQSGFITDIGYETYMKILEEAMIELKEEGGGKEEEGRGKSEENVLPSSFVRDCVLDTDLELLIPDSYVNHIPERIALYKELDSSKADNDLEKFRKMMRDRFGPVPEQTEELIQAVRLRWAAQQAGLEKLLLKNGKMTGYFISKQNSPFYQSETFTRILNFLRTHPHTAKMKEANNKLTITFEKIPNVGEALKKIKAVIS